MIIIQKSCSDCKKSFNGYDAIFHDSLCPIKLVNNCQTQLNTFLQKTDCICTEEPNWKQLLITFQQSIKIPTLLFPDIKNNSTQQFEKMKINIVETPTNTTVEQNNIQIDVDADQNIDVPQKRLKHPSLTLTSKGQKKQDPMLKCLFCGLYYNSRGTLDKHLKLIHGKQLVRLTKHNRKQQFKKQQYDYEDYMEDSDMVNLY